MAEKKSCYKCNKSEAGQAPNAKGEEALAFAIARKLELERGECNLGRLPRRTVGTQREERCKKFFHPFAIDRAVATIAQLADELVTPSFGRRQRHVGDRDRLVGFPHVRNATPALEQYQSAEELFGPRRFA